MSNKLLQDASNNATVKLKTTFDNLIEHGNKI